MVLKMERTFRFLVVDDYPSAARLLQEVMKNLQRRHEVHVVQDGVEALDFLYRRGAYVDAPHPNLILMDMNMPRLGGLETVTAIKNDPELCVIPVVMFRQPVRRKTCAKPTRPTPTVTWKSQPIWSDS